MLVSITSIELNEIIEELEKYTKFSTQLKCDIKNYRKPIPFKAIQIYEHKELEGILNEKEALNFINRDEKATKIISKALIQNYEYKKINGKY